MLTAVVCGFHEHGQVLRFEWAWKHMKPRKVTGLKGRFVKLRGLLRQRHWASERFRVAMSPTDEHMKSIPGAVDCAMSPRAIINTLL
jgi:hypothetical protein